jgi:LPS-assembly protein
MYVRSAVRGWNLACRARLSGRGRVAALTLAGAAVLAAASPVLAQQPAQPQQRSSTANIVSAKVRANPDAKMLVQANEMQYDYKNERVSAVGKVQIYYDGSILEADRVTHDRKTNRLTATGNVRYQTKDGNVIHTDHIDMDADFRDGFVQSLLVETADNTRMVAARADRKEGNITVLQSGAYTACEPCKENPQKPPFWQVKAARIIHNERERVIHYENASIEFFGVPIAYFPYFWHPDPTVKRQTGFLVPTWFSNSRTGTGVAIPYFWALAPNYDMTVTVAPTTEQIGPLVSAEWRHALVNGSYMIRAAGIFQQNPERFRDTSGISPGDREFRGSFETIGKFRINERWQWGWDATLLTDRYFLNDYGGAVPGGGRDRTSTVYLTGQGDRSYYDLRGLGFIGMGREDDQSEQPIIHPLLDYSYVWNRPILGGELGLTTNFVSLSRSETDFDRITPAFTNDSQCLTSVNPSQCLVRGMGGDYTRFTTQLNWRRTVTNPWGVVFKPFATARVDLATRDADLPGAQAAYAGGAVGRDSMVRTMPAVGMETRWPFISVHSWGTQIVEPIAQLVVRPNETHIGRFPNEDAQSLVFDDTNLFAIDKYSGYDRVEGGTRANVGVQYTANIHRYGMVNVLFGQSYHLAGKNSYAYSGIVDSNGQQTGLGLQSGLENDVSDYVGRAYFQPAGNLSYIARARFDKNDFDIRRVELEARATWQNLSLSTIYARYDPQPLIGHERHRESIYQLGTWKFHENWTVFGGAGYNLREGEFDLAMVGLNYVDECFAASFSYVADYSNFTYTKPVHRIMLRMNLRTIGGTGISREVGGDRTD